MGVQTAERVGARVPAAVRAERRAWLILWVAFATFCALVFATVKFTVDYVATAEVDQSARIVAARGQVVFSLPGSTDRTLLGSRTELGVRTTIALDRSVGQVELQLFDDSRVKLLAGSSLELTRMELGRFISQQSLMLTQIGGPIRYATTGPIDVVVPNGRVQLGPYGDYTVWIDDETTRVLVYIGEARVWGGASSLNVQEGRRAEIDPQRQVHGPFDRQVTLLANSDFAFQGEHWQPHDTSSSRLDVNGTRSWVAVPADIGAEGNALRVMRESAKREHGETGLVQKLEQDVSGFRHLWLQAWVRVDTAELSGGGQFGSEYPMMLRLTYEGPDSGKPGPWVVGFYYSNPDNRPVPSGVQFPQGEWKRYEVDLMKTDASSVPYRLLEFAVMGQGHSYDARVAGIRLVGE